MTYQAVDGDNNTAASDAATLSFTITVQKPEPPDTAPAFAVTVADQTYTESEASQPADAPGGQRRQRHLCPTPWHPRCRG